MNCKDCIHEKICVITAFPEAFENTKWEKEPCDHFKNKADYVEVKHGKWILEYGTYGKIICSECKNEAPITNKRDGSLQLQTLYVHSPYCHNCGAKMDGRRDT